MSNTNSTEPQNGNNAGERNNPPPPIGVKAFLMEDRSASVSWLIRLYIIISTILYIVPLLGADVSRNSYKRVLLGSAAVSALRLHQRLPGIQFSMEFARRLMAEDSLHYLLYSVLFLMAGPATMVLSPIFLFALLHASIFTKKVIAASGDNGALSQRLGEYINKLTNAQQQIFLFVATTEIVVFAVSVLMVFNGQASLMVPFFYYRFLQLRYTSQRNPYSRMAFAQFRMMIVQIGNHPRCPGLVKRFFDTAVGYVGRLAPATA